jgi:PPOX class probable F420-dependent enzyme
MWDTTTAFGQRVERYLAERQIIWLITTGDDGAPQPSPVWFLHESATLLIYSKHSAPKVRNIQARPAVALHFDSDPHGNDVVILHGTATLDPAAPRGDKHPAYVEKYRGGIDSLGQSPEAFAETYAAALRVTLTKVRGF